MDRIGRGRLNDVATSRPPGWTYGEISGFGLGMASPETSVSQPEFRQTSFVGHTLLQFLDEKLASRVAFWRMRYEVDVIQVTQQTVWLARFYPHGDQLLGQIRGLPFDLAPPGC